MFAKAQLKRQRASRSTGTNQAQGPLNYPTVILFNQEFKRKVREEEQRGAKA
jgi:hypothetical protein